MEEFRYIYQDVNGVTHFDRYFEYVERIRDRLPPRLAAFATDTERYALQGDSTLHDAWITHFHLTKDYRNRELLSTSISLGLMLATGDRHVSLNYRGVRHIRSTLQPDRWPQQPVDLLVHEFSESEPGVYQHAVEFDRGVEFSVEFVDFDFVET
jgi:hypothetical protein